MPKKVKMVQTSDPLFWPFLWHRPSCLKMRKNENENMKTSIILIGQRRVTQTLLWPLSYESARLGLASINTKDPDWPRKTWKFENLKMKNEKETSDSDPSFGLSLVSQQGWGWPQRRPLTPTFLHRYSTDTNGQINTNSNLGKNTEV